MDVTEAERANVSSQGAQALGQGANPVTDRDSGKHALLEVYGGIGHAAAQTRWTKILFAYRRMPQAASGRSCGIPNANNPLRDGRSVNIPLTRSRQTSVARQPLRRARETRASASRHSGRAPSLPGACGRSPRGERAASGRDARGLPVAPSARSWPEPCQAPRRRGSAGVRPSPGGGRQRSANGRHPSRILSAARRAFRVAYLEPLGITSLMDAAVWRDGRVIGVVCCEHVARPRRSKPPHSELPPSSTPRKWSRC